MGIPDVVGDLIVSVRVREVGGEDAAAAAAREVDWSAALPARARGPGWRLGRAIKRLFDVGAAGVLLALLAPLFLVLALVVLFDDGAPVLYPWRVVGHRGRRFTGYKFRTMVRDADRLRGELAARNEMSGPVFKIRLDPRITRAGRMLRRSSLDELPQLWSVLKGDMSLVGPRPMFPHEFAKCTPAQRAKLAVTPGITCLWQVSGRSDISEFDEWVELDFAYIRDWSLWLDLRVLVRTALVVVKGHGAH